MLEVQSLSRYYGDFAAIEKLSFRIQEKQVVGFLGLNGAGKSTLINHLMHFIFDKQNSTPPPKIDQVSEDLRVI